MIRDILKVIAVIIAAAFLTMVLVRFLSGEDTWICQEGEWVKHGVPTEGPPNKKCEQDNGRSNEIKNSADDEEKLPASEDEMIEVELFFGNTIHDPQVMDCEKTYPAKRMIKKSDLITLATETIEALLLGPTDREKEEGFVTGINDEVKVNDLTIEDSLAKIDFDEMLGFQVGGSCRTGAIQSQIAETLKQFSEIDEVLISINGRIEDILQP